MQWNMRTERALIRAGASSRRHVLVEVEAPAQELIGERPDVNVAFVLDRSGSMGTAAKFALAREAVERGLGMLRPTDRFSLVVYDEEVTVVTRSTLAIPDAIRRARSALSDVAPRGWTDLSGGWLRGCEQVAEFLSQRGVNRAFLLTDGLANRGITDRPELARHAAALRERGVTTSTFGVGEDFDERALRDMAHEGGGNFYYLATPAEIVPSITSELGEALEVTARGVAVEFTIPAGATAELLHRFRSETDASRQRMRVLLGDLVSRQRVAVVLELRFARGQEGDAVRLTAHVTADGGVTAHPAQREVTWRYASHQANDAEPRNVEVDREVARLHVARARAEATEANRAGNLAGAGAYIRSAMQRVRSYAGSDSAMLDLVGQMEAAAPAFAMEQLSPEELKREVFDAEVAMKSRSPGGKARR